MPDEEPRGDGASIGSEATPIAASSSIALPSIEVLAATSSSGPAPGNDPSGAGESNDLSSQRRKAGADYLNQALSKKAKGKDPFAATERLGGARRQGRQPKEDPEFVAFGAWLRENLVYVYMVLYIVAQSSSFVLVKISLGYMQTPAVLTFLHMLAAAGGLTLACQYDAFETPQMTLEGLSGSAVRVVLYSTQMLCTFSALHHNSVLVVVVWTTAGGAAIEALVSEVLGEIGGGEGAFSPEARAALMAGVGVGVLELIFDKDKALLGVLVLFLWSISKAVECVWARLLVDSTLGGRLVDFHLVSRIREVADREEATRPSTLTLMQNAVPAVPVLILGLICLEGKELVDHEPSVPGLKIMLLACAAYTLSTGCLLLLDERLLVEAHSSTMAAEGDGALGGQLSTSAPGRSKLPRPPPSVLKLLLRVASSTGAVVLFALEEYRRVSLLAVLLTLVSMSLSLLSSWRQQRSKVTRGGGGGGGGGGVAARV